MVAHPENKREKIALKEIYEQLALNVEDLTGDSQRYLAAVVLMLEGRPVLKEYAVAVLSALSSYTGQTYALENVAVNIVEEGINPSEITYTLAEIRMEYEAAQVGLTGLSEGGSQHGVITAQMERIAGLHTELRELVGDEAMVLVNNMLDTNWRSRVQ